MKGALRSAVILLAALIVSCGAASGPVENPPPAPPATLATQASRTYVDIEALRQAPFPPPPAPGSLAQREDEQAVLAWQGRRVDADCARAEATFFVSFRHLWGERSPFPEPLAHEVQAFFDRLDAEIGSLSRIMKARFRRPRPDGARGCPGSGRRGGGYAYPSTHAAISRVFAHVLADLVPERRDEFFQRADSIAHDRLVIGVHYPTDLAAGKELADRFHAALLQSSVYQADLARVRTWMTQSASHQDATPKEHHSTLRIHALPGSR